MEAERPTELRLLEARERLRNTLTPRVRGPRPEYVPSDCLRQSAVKAASFNYLGLHLLHRYH
jgi:hypothetical protein